MKVVFFLSSPLPSLSVSYFFLSLETIGVIGYGGKLGEALTEHVDSVCSNCLSSSWNRSIETEWWLTGRRKEGRIQIDFPFVVRRRICLLSFVLRFRNAERRGRSVSGTFRCENVRIVDVLSSDLVLERVVGNFGYFALHWQTVSSCIICCENLKLGTLWRCFTA